MTGKLFKVMAFGFLGIVFSGCATLEMPNWERHKFTRATEKDPAAEIICVWKPAEGTGMDNLPTRGFAGQILFFNRHDSEPIVVDGNVRVYLFDDVGTIEEQSKPIHQFDFEAQAWNTHARMSSVGPSYHIFIPYTRKNNPYRTACSLRVRMTTENGRAIFSDVIKVPLPGPKREGNRVTISDGKPLMPGQAGSTAEQAADADFQLHKSKMQRLEDLVRQAKQEQKSASRTFQKPPRTFQPRESHLLTGAEGQQLSQVKPFAEAGHSPTDQFPVQQNPLAGRVEAAVHPIAALNASSHPLTGRAVSQQAVQPVQTQAIPTQSAHSLNPLATAPLSQPRRSLSPYGTLPPRQPLNQVPRTIQPMKTPGLQPNGHPLGEMHPLDGFSTQNGGSVSQPVLMPKVRANAAPSSQAPESYQVSLLGR